jgi:hypothetical protein
MTTVVEQESSIDDTLTDTARAAIWGALEKRRGLGKLNRFLSYRDGRSGVPDVREGASDELKELAKQSVRNVCGVVVDTFNRGLSVVGFRSPTSDDDEPAWEWWQRQGLDARQAEVHDAALTYGWSFVSVLPDDDQGGEPQAATWSPRNVIAEFRDRRRDRFPERAVLMRDVEHPLFGEGVSVLFVDDLRVQAGFISKKRRGTKQSASDVILDGDPWEHKATYNGDPVCPVVPFWNERSAEDRDPRGEVEPLIQAQRALNSTNFDRLCVSRFSAFKQKWVIGWSPSAGEAAQMSASDVAAFEDEFVKVGQFDASPLAPYDNTLREMAENIALSAGIPLHQITGSLQNISQETAALAESAHQRKLELKRESYGESWEQVIRLAVEMSGGATPDEAAEVIWRLTEARSFAGVVDGIFKLATIPADASGVPVEQLLDLIPGMNQQRLYAIGEALRERRLNNALLALATLQPSTAPLTEA